MVCFLVLRVQICRVVEYDHVYDWIKKKPKQGCLWLEKAD
jgi:hypothetical protein